MPKVRQTCTRCSMRRQKCDRKDPCTRCIQNNEASSCSRKWQDGYDPRLHRTYPKYKAVQSSDDIISSGLTSNGVRQNLGYDTSLMQNVTPTQGAYSLHPTIHDITNATASRPLSDTDFANGVRQAAPNDFQQSRVTDESTSSGFLENGYERSSGLVPSNIPPLIHQHFSAENAATGHGYAGFGPREIEKQNLQTLIPTNLQISRLVEYHEKCLLWYHGCVHGPTFQMELNKALQGPNGFQLKCLDLRWSALLFSIMTASLTCTSDSVAQSWGFSKARKRYLSKQWYEASVACLHLADYTSKLSVYSIQAIQVLSMSAHIIGFSDKQFVIFGTALRIAQNLGLQRLVQDPELDTFPADGAGMSPSRKDILIRREVGRRIWMQMCIQDWFSIPSSDMYSINKQHFTTSRPRRIDDQDMALAGDQVPVATDSGNLLYDIASLMADFHDSVIVLSDPAAKYDQVLKYDSRMRAMCTQSKPQVFSAESTEASGPQWVRWARGVASIVQAHKIIMIHRSYLCKSFTDPRYTYTRWASVAASKTILREAEVATADVQRPAFWHDQAHVVGASITLCIDILHRSKSEPELMEHKKLVDQAITLLERYNDSTLAERGIRLLSSLLEGTAKKQPSKHYGRHDMENKAYPHEGNPLAWPLEDSQSIDAMWASRQSNNAEDGSQMTVPLATSSQQGPQLRTIPPTSIAGNGDALDVPTQNVGDFNLINGDGNFGAVDDNGMLSDTSWWTDLFSDYLPTQNGFNTPFLIEDPVTQAP